MQHGKKQEPGERSMQLEGKKIILAVTGSIAAYKTPELVRLLIKSGADVRVIMTPASTQFVSPLALSTVSKHKVHSNVSDGDAWNNHVEMGRWADAILVAPCSANTMARLAGGLCDNLVCAVYLSAACPVFVAPAMDEDMWMHPATRRNLSQLQEYGNIIIPIEHGELASGLIGAGRMAQPENIVRYLEEYFSDREDLPLNGLHALVTAGPTYERLDPVRFIGNFSTGKMGIALAEALAKKGAEVTLVLGPTTLSAVHPRIHTVPVESAAQMYEACQEVFPRAAISVLAAAVADYRPANKAEDKIKKTGDALELSLVKTTDILSSLGASKRSGQLLVGFALETSNELENARKKLATKNADLVILNSLKDEGAGFGHETNKVTMIDKEGNVIPLPLDTKARIAGEIVNYILKLRHVEEVV